MQEKHSFNNFQPCLALSNILPDYMYFSEKATVVNIQNLKYYCCLVTWYICTVDSFKITNIYL